MRQVKIILLAASALIGSIMMLSCGDETVTSGGESTYAIDGTIFYDCDYQSGEVRFFIRKDGSPFENATVKVNGYTVSHAGSGIYSAISPTVILSPGNAQTLLITVSSEVLYSAELILPDTFTADVVIPFNGIYDYSGAGVTVDWSASASSSNYILTVVKPDSAAAAADFAEFGRTGETVTGDAFRRDDGTDEPVPADYAIHVLAYRTTYYPLPDDRFPIPSGLPTGTIDEDSVSGTIGIGTLSISDTVFARLIPPE
jgi:hypothetical protein